MNFFGNTFLSIIILILIGYLLKKTELLKSDDVKPLNTILINILMPCMIFIALYTGDRNLFPKLWIMPFIPMLPALIVGLFTSITLKILNYSKVKILSFILVVILGNTAYMGYPIILGIFGSDGLIRAIFFDISTPILFLFVSILLTAKVNGDPKAILKNLIGFPILWGFSLGIIFNIFNIDIGSVLENTIENIGAAAIPIAMFCLGLSLSLSRMRKNFKVVSFVSLMKLILYPVLSFIICILLGLKGIEFNIGVIESAMPSSILSLALTINYNLDNELVADCIFFSTIVSFISLPIIISLL
ncbi:MAG: AEC family transporter [Methanobrevibacter sp. CfCl-M3]